VSGAPGHTRLNSSPSGNFRGCSAIIHRTVQCTSGATATSRATVDYNTFNARLRAQRTEDTQLAHRIVYRTCPVHHRIAQRPHKSELQRSNPNGPLTWLAHRTVSGAPCDSTLPTAIFGGWGSKYPNHPTFNGIQVSTLLHLTRASIQYKTHQRDLLCSFELLCLDRFFSFSFFLVIISIVTEARDTNCVVVLAGTCCPV
jgi:hypothetical protein